MFEPNMRPLHFWWQLGHDQNLNMLVTVNRTPPGGFSRSGELFRGKYAGLKYLGGERPRWGVIYED